MSLRLSARAARQLGIKAETISGLSGFAWQCEAAGLETPVGEFRFHPTRRWRFDWAWPDQKLALEVEGIVYPKKGSGDYRAGGRHASAKGLRGDIEKYLAAAELGWTVIRCLPEHIENGRALSVMEAWFHR